MAFVVRFTPPSLSSQQYDEIIKRLEAAGEGSPIGRLFAVAFGPTDALRVSSDTAMTFTVRQSLRSTAAEGHGPPARRGRPSTARIDVGGRDEIRCAGIDPELLEQGHQRLGEAVEILLRVPDIGNAQRVGWPECDGKEPPFG